MQNYESLDRGKLLRIPTSTLTVPFLPTENEIQIYRKYSSPSNSKREEIKDNLKAPSLLSNNNSSSGSNNNNQTSRLATEIQSLPNKSSINNISDNTLVKLSSNNTDTFNNTGTVNNVVASGNNSETNSSIKTVSTNENELLPPKKTIINNNIPTYSPKNDDTITTVNSNNNQNNQNVVIKNSNVGDVEANILSSNSIFIKNFGQLPSFYLLKGVFYQYLSVLGAGGFGLVIRALNTETKELFALKIFQCETRAQSNCPYIEKAFNEEVHTLFSLKGTPGIINIINFGFVDLKGVALPNHIRHYLIVLELADTSLNKYMLTKFETDKEIVQGILQKNKSSVKLNNWIDNNNAGKEFPFAPYKGLMVFDMITTKSIFKSMVKSIACVHTLGYLHADLKPENFLIVKGNVVVADFGLSSKFTEFINMHNGLFKNIKMGTDAYLAPEIATPGFYSQYHEDQKRNKKRVTHTQNIDNSIFYGTGVDVYALGRILLQMIYGEEFLYETSYYTEWIPYWNKLSLINNTDYGSCLIGCLDPNPETRISIQELLSHPFLSEPTDLVNITQLIDDKHFKNYGTS